MKFYQTYEGKYIDETSPHWNEYGVIHTTRSPAKKAMENITAEFDLSADERIKILRYAIASIKADVDLERISHESH